jgi:hypothetical protein
MEFVLCPAIVAARLLVVDAEYFKRRHGRVTRMVQRAILG